MSKHDEYLKLLREHEAKWGEERIGIVPEYARTLYNDAEYAEWYADLKARLKAYEEHLEEFGNTHYFPGCYGDPLTDCN